MTELDTPQVPAMASPSRRSQAVSPVDPAPELGAPVTAARGARRKSRRRIPRWASAVGTVVFLVGVFVRLTVGDQFPVCNTIYYATPWSLLGLLAGANALAAHQWGRATAASRWIAASAGCMVVWAASSWVFAGRPAMPGDVRVIVWNMSHGNRGLPGIVKSLAELNPDIAILVEADPRRVQVREIFEAEFPEHEVSMLGAGIVLVSRWPAGESIPYHIGDVETESRVREIDVETPWGPWTVFAVDMGSSPRYLRAKPLQELARLIDRRGDHPVIVGGDFNTPLDSEFFASFRDIGLRELFLSVGQGYLPTWPVPTPVLSLDQIWVNEFLEPHRCERSWSWRSDHAAVVGSLSPR